MFRIDITWLWSMTDSWRWFIVQYKLIVQKYTCICIYAYRHDYIIIESKTRYRDQFSYSICYLIWIQFAKQKSIHPHRNIQLPHDPFTSFWCQAAVKYASNISIKFIRIFCELRRKILLNTGVWQFDPFDPAVLTRCFWRKSVGFPGRAGWRLEGP